MQTDQGPRPDFATIPIAGAAAVPPLPTNVLVSGSVPAATSTYGTHTHSLVSSITYAHTSVGTHSDIYRHPPGGSHVPTGVSQVAFAPYASSTLAVSEWTIVYQPSAI